MILQRFRGALFWIDWPNAKRRREWVAIGRAIHRPAMLVIEFQGEGASYHVSLNQRGARSFQGRWERKDHRGSAQGDAECTLTFPPEGAAPEDREVILKGTWSEDIEWRWFGLLEAVAAFTDERDEQ